MTQLGFFVDVSKCSGCKTCAVACKDAHNLPVGMNFRKVHEYAGGNWKQAADGSWTQDVFGYYVSLGCNHCSDPACVKVCPYHAPVLDETAHKMRKCDACFDRLQRGLQPICVESCPNRAIEFGEIEELRKKHGKLAEVAPLPSASKTQPNLVLVVPAQARPAGDTSGTEY